jgi:hypothetical protein
VRLLPATHIRPRDVRVVPIADRPSFEEEGAEQPFDQRPGITLLLRPRDEPMRIERVRLHDDAVERERNADRFAGVRDASVDV